MAQKLNIDTSVVDFLKSTGQDSSFSAPTKLAGDFGIANYVGSAEQNISLLNTLKAGSTPKAPATEAGNTADSIINGPQDSEIALFEQMDGPQTRESAKTVDSVFSEISNTLKETLGVAPETTSLSERFSELRRESGVSDLESQLAELRRQQREVEATKRQRVQAQRGKQVATGVMAGRIGEVERQENERLDVLNREAAYLNDQLTTSYNVINTIMGFEEQDYQNASKKYDSKFTQAMQMIDLARGIRSDEERRADREQDVAAANLQIMYNALASGEADFDALDDTTISTITKLEVQSGLPLGFYKALKARAGQAEIVSTNSREAGGTAYTDIVMRKPDGSLYVETIVRGSTKSGSGTGSSGSGTTIGDGIDFYSAKMADIKKLTKDTFAPTFANKLMSELTDEQLRLFMNDYVFESNDQQMSIEPAQYYESWKAAAGIKQSTSSSSGSAVTNPFRTQ